MDPQIHNLARIHDLIVRSTSKEETLNETEEVQALEQNTDKAAQEQFLSLAKQYSFAFSGLRDVPTFSDAVVSLLHTASAMRKKEFVAENLKETLENLDMTITRQGFLLLRGIHANEKSYQQVHDGLHGKSYQEGLPIAMAALKEDAEITDRVYLKTTAKTQGRLRGEGNFPAPGFLDKISPNLVYLDLSGLWIDAVLPTISNLSQLVQLDLSNNCFKKLPSELGELKNLRHLDISKNGKLKEIPESIGSCAQLVSLIASKTKVAELPSSLEGLQNLKLVDVEDTEYNPNKSRMYVSLIKKGVEVKSSAPKQVQTDSSESELHERLLRDLLSGGGMPRSLFGMPGMPGMRGRGSPDVPPECNTQ